MRDMERSPLRIVSVGESTIDHYLDIGKQFVGGISLNFAVNCKRTGAEDVSLVSRIGTDHGARLLEKLKQEGIDASRVTTKQGETARQDITLTKDGERIFPTGGYHPGVLNDYRMNRSELQFIQSHDIIASAMFRQVEPLFFQVMELPEYPGWRVADFLDLSDYDGNMKVVEGSHEKLRIAFVSGAQEIVEKLRPLSRSSNCIIVITLGADGSVALVKGEPTYQPSVATANILDSTGCGDAFQAAFTVSYWRDRDIGKGLVSGAQQAARVLQHYGSTD
jgi:fructoselysine 6-kinase